MAASPVSICNRALDAIGSAPILALDSTSKATRLCARLYPELRDELLQGHLWKFATQRFELAASADAPLFGYTNAYPEPDGCLRVVWVHDTNFPTDGWKREGGSILTNLSAPLQVRTIQRITDTGLFPPNFVNALVQRIAMDLAVPIAQSEQMRAAREKDLQVALILARGVDILEERPAERAPSWIGVRY